MLHRTGSSIVDSGYALLHDCDTNATVLKYGVTNTPARLQRGQADKVRNKRLCMYTRGTSAAAGEELGAWLEGKPGDYDTGEGPKSALKMQRAFEG